MLHCLALEFSHLIAVVDQLSHFCCCHFWDKTDYAGASIKSMIALGLDKGYRPIYVTDGGFNLIFVDEPYFERFGVRDNSATALYKAPDPASNRLFNKDPEGRGDVPFANPYLEFGEVRIEKKFLSHR